MKKFIFAIGIMLIILSTCVLAGERLSMGYIYSSSISHSQIIENTNNSINVVSPTCFDITLNGNLEINGLLDKEFIEEMHEKGIKVTPFLSNHWGQKRAEAMLDNPNKIILELSNVINEYNIDGVNVDIENISIEYKEKLTNFVKLLREELGNDKTISVAVAANPEKLTKTWVASYDYKGLAEYADYLVLMAYDEHSQGGAAGPVASINFVEESLNVILEDVSKDKVVLGIPLYGRFWKEGADKGGEAIVLAAVENLVKKYHLVPYLNTETMTAELTIAIDGISTNAYVNGRYLSEGTYKIWYESESSIKAKLKLVNEYNILGTALWALDNEGKSMWNYFETCLNETEYENEKEIRVRQRLESYAKILTVKPVNKKVAMEKPENKIIKENEVRKNILKNIETIQNYEYEIIECVIKENELDLSKKGKVKIRGIGMIKMVIGQEETV